MPNLINSKPCVLIYSVCYFPFVGGAEIAWKEITDRIYSVEFDMVTAKLKSDLPAFEKIGNIKVYRVGIGHSIDKYIFPFWGLIKGLELNRKKNYAIAIGVMYNYAGLAGAFLKSIKPQVKLLLNLQDGDTDEYIKKKTKGLAFLLKNIYTKPDYIVAIAKFLIKRALDNGATGEMHLIPNGVSIDKFDRNISENEMDSLKDSLKINKENKIIITTSRLNYKNAIDDLIKSLSFLDEKYILLILGAGEEEENLLNLVKELKLTDRVKFLGYQPHEEMIKYLKISDVFCRPSLQEGLGNSFLEAMMAGLPVIAPPVGGIPDFLHDKKTGVFCQVRNPESIATSINLIMTNNVLKKEIIEQGKEMIRKNYDWNLVAKKYEILFTKIASTKSN